MNAPHHVIGPVNLGNPREITVLELASLAIDLTGSCSRVVHRPRPQDDPRQRRPEISKANDTLEWTPRTPIATGLGKTIEYFEKLLSDQNLRESIIHDRGADAQPGLVAYKRH